MQVEKRRLENVLKLTIFVQRKEILKRKNEGKKVC